jgi:hypothetical protein
VDIRSNQRLPGYISDIKDVEMKGMENFNSYRRIFAKVEDNLKFKAEEVIVYCRYIPKQGLTFPVKSCSNIELI